VHSLILLNNSLQVQVLSAQDLKFGQENRGGLRSGYGLCVGWWVAGLTTEIGGRWVEKGVGTSSGKFNVLAESPGGSKWRELLAKGT